MQADIELLRRFLDYANRCIVADIESECVRLQLSDQPGTWHDTRPMVDPREHSPEVIDQSAEALSLAETTGLIVRHPVQRYLVRIVANPDARQATR